MTGAWGEFKIKKQYPVYSAFYCQKAIIMIKSCHYYDR